jgi:hypothetical protein
MFDRIFIIYVLTVCSLFSTYKYDKETLGNIAITVGTWKTNISGNIHNGVETKNHTDYKNDLGFKDTDNVTSFGIDAKNDITWLPNIYIDYFSLNSTADNILSSEKLIDDNIFNNSISTSVKYSEVNMILYGFFRQDIFEFDIGIDIKKIEYNQITKENIGSNTVIIYGPKDIIPQPYIALKIDLYLIDTVLKAEISTLSFGNDEANSYKYSLNYRVFRNIYISYGHKLSTWKATNLEDVHEKYDVTISGNYFNAKVLF